MNEAQICGTLSHLSMMCVSYGVYVEVGIDKIASVRICNQQSLSSWLSRGSSTNGVQSKAASWPVYLCDSRRAERGWMGTDIDMCLFLSRGTLYCLWWSQKQNEGSHCICNVWFLGRMGWNIMPFCWWGNIVLWYAPTDKPCLCLAFPIPISLPSVSSFIRSQESRQWRIALHMQTQFCKKTWNNSARYQFNISLIFQPMRITRQR